MVPQIRRAALSVKLNLAEGATRKSDKERKRYYEIARGSVVEIDAAIETAFDLSYFSKEELLNLGEYLNKCCYAFKHDGLAKFLPVCRLFAEFLFRFAVCHLLP